MHKILDGNMDTIDKINYYLVKQGKTGADLSRALGLSNSIYSQWNKKKTNPKRSKLSVIAEYLGVSVEDILPDDEEVLPKAKKESAPDPKTEGAKWDNDEDFKEAVALLKKMDKETLRVFVKAARGAVGEQQR